MIIERTSTILNEHGSSTLSLYGKMTKKKNETNDSAHRGSAMSIAVQWGREVKPVNLQDSITSIDIYTATYNDLKN